MTHLFNIHQLSCWQPNVEPTRCLDETPHKEGPLWQVVCLPATFMQRVSAFSFLLESCESGRQRDAAAGNRGRALVSGERAAICSGRGEPTHPPRQLIGTFTLPHVSIPVFYQFCYYYYYLSCPTITRKRNQLQLCQLNYSQQQNDN